MSYVELMNEKAKITTARAKLDEEEKKLDEQIKLASHSYACTLMDRMCELGRQIEELGYHVMDEDFNDWIDFGALSLDKKADAERYVERKQCETDDERITWRIETWETADEKED